MTKEKDQVDYILIEQNILERKKRRNLTFCPWVHLSCLWSVKIYRTGLSCEVGRTEQKGTACVASRLYIPCFIQYFTCLQQSRFSVHTC